MLTAKERKLLEALEPEAAKHDTEIVSVEIVGSKKAPTIRVYIDCEGGISFDELALAQEWVNLLMDDIDPFPGAYTLEVSSPGIDRPLRTPEHFERFVGEKARVVMAKPHEGRAKWTGILKGYSDDAVLLDVDGDQVSLPYEDIKKANVIATIDFGS
ncbi:MAG: ribosome maturation factor RimP [Coriobacteriia bacterium]|nr:ribosome maturation factor RimP [Coriobacteriia bacterium]